MNYNNIFDTHAHYDDEQFDGDRDELLTSLPDKGVKAVVSCGVDIKTSEANMRLAEKYDYFYFAAGFHPENLEEFTPMRTDDLMKCWNHEKCVAVGEIGLDYHWMKSIKERQRLFFVKQIYIANELRLPVIIHDREAHGDTLEMMKLAKPKAGVLHCFSGSKEMAREIINMGLYIGLNGVATFKNARKSLEVVKEIPLERLVLETDCPYLCPEPHRGKRNDSSYIPLVAERIGEVLERDPQEILDITYENSKRLFRL